MTITHEQALTAYRTMMSISGKPTKAAVSLKLFRLKKQLRDAVDFVTEEETKLVEQYGGQITADGRILIDDADKRTAFAAALEEVYKMDFAFGEKAKLKTADLPEMSVADLEALDPFVDFD